MMDQPKYRIEIFWSDEDGGYIANVPDLRYCSAFGETYEDALHEVLVAMELYLDTLRETGRPVPEPTTLRRGYARFEIYRDERNEYRWRFRADNNEIVMASSEGYRSREDVEHAIQQIKEQASQSEVEAPASR